MLNSHYSDMLRALSDAKVKFLLVGAYAMAAHGYTRGTSDIDIWVAPTPDNADLVLQALEAFGAPLQGLTSADLQDPKMVFQVGVAPLRIDIMSGVTGLVFQDAYENSREAEINGFTVRILSVADLIKNKLATGREQDKADALALRNLKPQS